MNDEKDYFLKTHNTALIIMTITSIGVIMETFLRMWEYWVPGMILAGVVFSWVFHLRQYRDSRFRENVYLLFLLFLLFYYGCHESSYFDVVIVATLIMVTCSLLKRSDFLSVVMIVFYIIMTIHTIYAISSKSIEFDSIVFNRLTLHLTGFFGVYKALDQAVKNSLITEDKLNRKEKDEEVERTGMEDFLVNISHELRTPVNVINGMSTLVLKKGENEDVYSIRDAGLRLSHQIEDIQNYSELQRGDVVLEKEKYVITSVLSEIVTNFGILGRNRNIELMIDLDPNVPRLMRGDINKINKIIIHLLDNAIKFTKKGGVFLKIYSVKRDNGANLVIEVTDTGIGMSELDIERISKGRYQGNEKRNRNTGGIGLGLSIVYGFVRLMDGFVTIESKKNKGTTVRVSIVQDVLDSTPCLTVDTKSFVNIAFFVLLEKYKSIEVRDFCRRMASDLASGLRLNLYFAPSFEELKRIVSRGDITHVFMGEREYECDPAYFDKLADQEMNVAIFATDDFRVKDSDKIIAMPEILYGLSMVRVLNGDVDGNVMSAEEISTKPTFDGIRALIVDDEPMNLVVATGLLRDYNMITDTAGSGKEAISKYENNEYDVIFMDHMMPEMDGVEAMQNIRVIADENRKVVKIIALTANAVSGAKEMFLRKGFDGFISKPIKISELEKVVSRVLSDVMPAGVRGGDE